MLRGVDTEVIKNNDDQDTTPSAVWIDRRDRLYVGRAARDRGELDPDNTCLEFKLRMGSTGGLKRFAAAGREMTAEQLSAEVLKSLRGDVRQRDGVDIDAAVITVPAAFDLSACEATRRAANLAGLVTAPLLQEPTAAAFAYGFQREQDARWLVYDLGGGTFDAAVVQVSDGEFTVLTHRGDDFLGGKLIDWQVVEGLLIPAVAGEFGLDDLRRGDPRWSAVISKLKLAAEAAKIRLSRADVAEIILDLDIAPGRRVEFEYELFRADVERLAEPYIVRSINLCRRALADAHLQAADISRLLLVGGPTLSPYLRERLADPDAGLGIPVDHSQDPLTVVARGAAIFAGTQRRPEAASAAPLPGQYTVQLEYDPVGPDTEPIIAGRIHPPGGAASADPIDFTGYGIELVNTQARPAWRSGRVAPSQDGLFTIAAWAGRGRQNTYQLELTDSTGARLPLTPDQLSYTVGAVETSPLLTNSIGVGLEGNATEWLISRGTPLPAYGRARLRTVVELRRGAGGGMIRIPFIEGEHARADRNRQIGRLEVVAAQVARDVPEGSEVQVRVAVDESRLIVARAYVPLLDEEFEQVVELRTETAPAHEVLREALRAERQRLAEVRERQRASASPVAEMLLFQLDSEQIEQQTADLVDAAQADQDAAVTCGRRMLDLRAAIDAIEEALEWPELVAKVEQMIANVRQLANDIGTPDDLRRIGDQEAGVKAGIDDQDPRVLRMHLDQLNDLALAMLDRSGQLDVLIFDDLVKRRAEMLDPRESAALISQGEVAIQQRDRTALRTINTRLRGLLPVPPPPPDPFSTVRAG